MWRHRWYNNIFLNIFMDSKMNRLMTHRDGPKSSRFFVNDPMTITDYMRNFEHPGLKKFIHLNFY